MIQSNHGTTLSALVYELETLREREKNLKIKQRELAEAHALVTHELESVAKSKRHYRELCKGKV